MSFNTQRGFTLLVLCVPHGGTKDDVHIAARYEVNSKEDVEIPTSELDYVGQRLGETLDMIISDARKRQRERRIIGHG